MPMPPMGARESMPISPDDAAIRDLLLQQVYDFESMPISPDDAAIRDPLLQQVYNFPSMPISPEDAAIRDLLLQQGREVAPPVPGPATGGIGSLAPTVSPC
jgi:hypothetical protein